MNSPELNSKDTICALATAAGGPISIIRLSGLESAAHAGLLWHGSKALQELPPRHLSMGRLCRQDGQVIDSECLAVRMPGPHSYTGEDTVEFQFHGSPLAARLALEELQKIGVRLAGPGEFTRRAFLNGRLDLTQAEAVADIISASSEAALGLANRQLDGYLGQRLRGFHEKLSGLLAECESHLDFPEEDMDWRPTAEMLNELKEISQALSELGETASAGEILRGCLTVALAGQPNVGKSSLLNYILGRNRAIVSPIPGTTRDTIEADCILRGIHLRFIDTAGLRDSSDLLEKQGIERSRQTIGQADIVIWITDATRSLQEQDYDGPSVSSDRLLKIANKCDQCTSRLGSEWSDFIPTCALTGEGIDRLYDAIENAVWQGRTNRQSDFAVNARHGELLRQAVANLDKASAELAGEIWELASIGLRSAVQNLGQITGQSVEPDVLGEIFAKFCIGK